MSDLGRQLDALLLALPGVISLYSTEPALARSARELTSESPALVRVTGSVESHPVHIIASVGVDATAQAPSTAASIAAAIRATLPEGATTEIVVRVSRVNLD